ncbi:Formyl transferase, N-terminal [Dillenia turbinata]|uniref:phosphoribosylglycinamide formyltransferase 1 n=1 Tax=Dillenia turbinata TaxID=194707 RepID=A0AAN8UP74_9MAGN
MEAQTLFSKLHSNPEISLFHITQKSRFPICPSSSSSYSSSSSLSYFLQPLKSISRKSQNPQRVRRLECKNSAVEVGDLAENKEVLGSQVKRKKLAVFVSGGGSNFRSIHEASVNGSVFGDVVVLVTNKPAFGGKGYYGMKVHKAVISSGARYSGPTVHFVDEHYDTGRILAQRAVPVLANDTAEELAARVLHQEHKLYVEVVAALCEDRIIWREDGVPLIQSKENPEEYS